MRKGRISKAEKAVTAISKTVKQPGYFTVVIKLDDKVIFSNRHISKIELTKVYLRNLAENIAKHPEFTAKEILDAYKSLWSKYKIISSYTDSYGHTWLRNSFLGDRWLITYINNILNSSKQ